MPELLLTLGTNPNVQDVEVDLLTTCTLFCTPSQALLPHLVRVQCQQQIKPAACLMFSSDAQPSRCSVYNQLVPDVTTWPGNANAYLSERKSAVTTHVDAQSDTFDTSCM